MVQAIADNLDTPRAFAALNSWITETESGVEGGSPGEMARALDSLLGLAF